MAATHVLHQVSSSPLKAPSSSPAPLRRINPSPEKRPHSSVLIVRVEDGSPKKRRLITSPVEFTLGEDPIPAVAMNSRRIELSFPLVLGGRAVTPSTPDQWKELTSIFPSTIEVWIGSPYLTVRVRELPSPPWPLSVGSIPLNLTTEDDTTGPMNRGDSGRSKTEVLPQYDLRNNTCPIFPVLADIFDYFRSKNVVLQEVFHFPGFFRIVVADGTDLDTLPWRIANQGAFYRFGSQELDPDPSALRTRAPNSVVRDNTDYLADNDRLLRPGIMVSSSTLPDGSWKSSTLGILVVDKIQTPFITAAAHGFNADGEVWHPDPNGTLIGNIVQSIPDSDVALVKLEKGLRFVNQTFGNAGDSDGIVPSGLSPHSTVLSFDNISMDNPFSGYCLGQVLAPGIKIEGSGKMIQHFWVIMDASIEQVPIDGSCGTVIFNEDSKVVGFFRFKKKDSPHCYAVSSEHLLEAGYQIGLQEIQS